MRHWWINVKPIASERVMMVEGQIFGRLEVSVKIPCLRVALTRCGKLLCAGDPAVELDA